MSTRQIIAVASALLLIVTGVWLFTRHRVSETTTAVGGASPTVSVATPPAPTELSSAVELQPTRASVIDAAPQAPVQSQIAAARLMLRVVRKDEGSPVPHCAVKIQALTLADDATRRTEAPFTAVSETEADGRVELLVRPGERLFLKVGTRDYLHERDTGESFGIASAELEPFAADEVRELIVELPFGHDLAFWGKVVSSVDDTPIVRALVSWSVAEFTTQLEQPTEGKFVRSEAKLTQQWRDSANPATTDSEGIFEIRVPSWNPGVGRIRAVGFSTALVSLVSGHEVRERALELRLTPSASVDVQVNDHTAGATEPITVDMHTPSYELLVPDGGFTRGTERWRATCDGSGQCILTDLPARALISIELKRGGALVMPIAERLILEPGEQRRLEWTIGSGSTLSGRVVDQHGAPVVRRKMWLVQRNGTASTRNSGPCYFYYGGGNDAFGTATTDDEGQFAFHEVPAGVWWLGPAVTRSPRDPPDLNDVAAVVTVIQTSDGTNQSVVLSVDRGLFIRGKVVDPEGRPVAQVFVTAWGTSIRGPTAAHQSDNDGAFVIGPVAATPHVVRSSAAAGYTEPEPVTATPNGAPIVLQLQAGGGITGRVVDGATGDGVRARVSMTPLASLGWMGTSTDADGSFDLDGLAPGNYDVAAMTDDARVGIERDVVIVAGREPPNVQIRLEPGAHVTIRYKGSADHVSAFVYSGTTIVEADGLRTGTQRTFVAPVGRVRIEVNGGGDLKQSRELDLVAGETREVDFEIP